MPASVVLAEFVLGGDTNHSSGPFVGGAFRPRRFTSTRGLFARQDLQVINVLSIISQGRSPKWLQNRRQVSYS